MHIHEGETYVYPEVNRKKLDDLKLGVLDRYYAFRKGDPYNGMLNQLSTRRMEEDGIVQTAHLIPNCASNDDLDIREEIIAGEPRVFRIGVGADTEGLVLSRANFTVHRLNNLGSTFEIDLYASFLEQTITTGFDWYFLHTPSRLYLRPEVSFSREQEDQFYTITTRAGMGPYVTWDNVWGHGTLGVIPEWSWTRTFEGAQKGDTRFLSGIVRASLMSHDFEFFSTAPRSGYSFEASVNLNRRDVFSDVTAQRLSFSGEHLWNVANLSPPFLVFGTRYAFRTTVADRNDPQFLRLPPQFVHYLGGSEDLRGFSRNDIPLEVNPDRTGALSTAYVGLESRFVEVLPFNIQPFVFADFGATGDRSFSLKKTIYWNPGVGLRWESPIGVLRGTYARGLLLNNNDPANERLTGHQFYVSFGEEF